MAVSEAQDGTLLSEITRWIITAIFGLVPSKQKFLPD